eukprot:gene45332-60552_t
MRKEVWFGLSIMAAVVLAAFILLPPVAQMSNGHLGLLMLALPHLAPPMSAEDRIVPLPPFAQVVSTTVSNKVLPGLIRAIKGSRNAAVPLRDLLNHLFIAILPALAVALIMGAIFLKVTAPLPPAEVEGVVAMGGTS